MLKYELNSKQDLMHQLFLQELSKLATPSVNRGFTSCCASLLELRKPRAPLQNTVSLWDALGWRSKVNSCQGGQ